MSETLFEPRALPVPPSLLGESPFWHPMEASLYWCDIAGMALNRFTPATGAVARWTFDQQPGCCAPVLGGGVLLALRDGLWHFDPQTERRRKWVDAPYDSALERFNDGKVDAAGRLWVGTIYEPRSPALASLYRWSLGELERMAGGVTVSNGLAFSPDGATMYWSDTTSHQIFALDLDLSTGTISRQRPFASFPRRQPEQSLASYGGRPDGAAVDAEGCYWVAMYEGQRLLRLSPDGEQLQEVKLPVQCPTMPCFGGHDLRTLYVTTVSDKRPADELRAQPLAGAVLQMRVAVPGLPVNFAK
jgi:sugar lactone lactonase YvrE